MLKYLITTFNITICLVLLSFGGICQTKPSVPQWVADIGGTGSSVVSLEKVDKLNNVYITGIFTGTVDFDPSAAVKNLTSVNGSVDVYIAKYDTNGNLVWAVSVGGNGTDQPNGIDLDNNGNVAVTGQYDSPSLDADPGPGVTTLTNTGNADMFIINLDANGNFTWAKSIGGSGIDYGNKIAVDNAGNRIIAGQFQSTIHIGATALTATGTYNGLIAKFDATGNLLWAMNLGQSGDNGARGVVSDSNNDIIVTGAFTGTVNFNPLGTAQNLTATGTPSYIAKYSAAGQLIWVQPINGGIAGYSSNICVDSNNNVYADGSFSSVISFPTGVNLSPQGSQDIYLSKFAPDGTFQLAEDIGGSGASGNNNGIAVGSDNNIYISGYFTGTIDFDPSPAIANIKYHGQRDLFLAKYNSSGAYQWALGAGSAACNNTFGRAVGVDSNNDVLLSGAFCSTANFDVSGCTSFSVTAQSPTRDSFIAKYVPSAPSITNNTITAPSPAIFCLSGDPGNIAGTIPTGGNGSYTYQWQSSLDGTTFTDINGATSKDYDPPVINATTYYLRNVNSGTCATPVSSNIITIQVSTATSGSIANNTILAPATTSFCVTGTPGNINGSTPAGGSGTYTYQWQSSADNITFNDIPGATSTGYDPLTVTSTSYFRRIVTSGNCTTPSTSNVITIQISPFITNNTITAPSTSTFCLNGDPDVITGATPVGGTGTYSYQWQNSVDGVTFADIPGATAINYDPPSINVTNYYQRVATSGSCSSISNVVTIQIQTPILDNVITTSSSVSFCSIPGSVPTGGAGTYTYQWQSSTDGINFTDIPGATSQEYDPPPTSVTTYYRRTAISGTCNAPLTSNIVTVQVQSVVSNNSITAPAITTFCSSGDPDVMSGSSPTGGNGTYTYQWQSSVDNINFTDISGATAKDYDPPVINATTWFRRTVISGVCLTPSVSNVVNIQVQQALANNSITAPATVIFCVSGDPANIVGSVPTGGDNTLYAYQWQTSTDGVNFTNIASAVAKDYDPPIINATTYYQRLTTSGTCTVPINSNIVSIQILPALTNNTITTPAVNHFCTVGDPDIIIGNTPSGGNGTYSYQWQSSADNITFADIPGAMAKDYDPPVINATTYYKRNIISGACSVVLSSNTISIIKDIMPVANAGADATICVGDGTILNASGGTIYQWSPATGLSNTNTANPTASPSTTTTYTVTAFNGTCSSTASVAVNVIQKPTADAGADQQIVSGQLVQLSGNVSGSNIQYHWSPTMYLDNPNSLTPIASPAEDITYTLTVTSANNCFIITDDVFIKVFPKVVIPNTFTPNGDGINDLWSIPTLSSYTNCILYVYNRLGTVVFKSIGYTKAWDARYNGKPIPAGTYYYTIDLKNGSKIISGWVAVVR